MGSPNFVGIPTKFGGLRNAVFEGFLRGFWVAKTFLGALMAVSGRFGESSGRSSGV